MNHRLHIFHDHVGKLRHKHVQSLHSLFESHTSTLATAFSALPVESLLSSLPATKLGFNKRDLEHEFERWQRERNTEARRAFDEMMGENSFVEFWGRLGKIGGAGVDNSIQNDDIGEEEGEGEERVDMKKLAKAVDVKEIVKVLKVCELTQRRCSALNSDPLSSRTTNAILFSNMFQKKGRGGSECVWVFSFGASRLLTLWLVKDYVGNMKAPQLSVHVPEKP